MEMLQKSLVCIRRDSAELCRKKVSGSKEEHADAVVGLRWMLSSAVQRPLIWQNSDEGHLTLRSFNWGKAQAMIETTIPNRLSQRRRPRQLNNFKLYRTLLNFGVRPELLESDQVRSR